MSLLCMPAQTTRLHRRPSLPASGCRKATFGRVVCCCTSSSQIDTHSGGSRASSGWQAVTALLSGHELATPLTLPAPACLLSTACRRSGDDAMKPNQKLNVMLQRILRADYSFPADKPLRWVVGRAGAAAGPAACCSWCAGYCSLLPRAAPSLLLPCPTSPVPCASATACAT